jgi:hypothetical protein
MNDEETFEKHGWIVECLSPLEVSYEDGSFARGGAAMIVLHYLRSIEDQIEKINLPLLEDETWDQE